MSTRAPGAAATSGPIYEESARQLARWRDRYRGRPDRERRRLWLLALEREQVVSIAYRESAIADRIARMPLAEEARDLIRHAHGLGVEGRGDAHGIHPRRGPPPR